jgi:AcrR family transcriptional regulator
MFVYIRSMSRTRLVPDAEIFALILGQLAEGGEKAVTFASVAAVSGLAAPTLVQRYGSRDAMVVSAVADLWDRLDAATEAVEAEALASAKGALGMLKALSDLAGTPEFLAISMRDQGLRARAEAWRMTVETALAKRLGGGAKGHDAGAALFAMWQGRLMWDRAGGKGFKLWDAAKRLA